MAVEINYRLFLSDNFQKSVDTVGRSLLIRYVVRLRPELHTNLSHYHISPRFFGPRLTSVYIQ